jgi:hypothetical protein
LLSLPKILSFDLVVICIFPGAVERLQCVLSSRTHDHAGFRVAVSKSSRNRHSGVVGDGTEVAFAVGGITVAVDGIAVGAVVGGTGVGVGADVHAVARTRIMTNTNVIRFIFSSVLGDVVTPANGVTRNAIACRFHKCSAK